MRNSPAPPHIQAAWRMKSSLLDETDSHCPIIRDCWTCGFGDLTRPGPRFEDDSFESLLRRLWIVRTRNSRLLRSGNRHAIPAVCFGFVQGAVGRG